MDGDERGGGDAADPGGSRGRFDAYSGSGGLAREPAAAAFPQSMRQLGGALVVLAGCLLPFGPALTSSLVSADALEAMWGRRGGSGIRPPPGTLGAMPACETFIGACWLAIALLVIVNTWGCIRERRAGLSPALFVLPCGWSFAKLSTLSATIPGFDWGWLGRLDRLNQLALEVGSGFFLIWLGSTFVALDFLLALAGALTLGRRRPWRPSPGAASGRKTTLRR